MIEREKMFEPLLQADPSFVSGWNEFVEEWGNEVELPMYIALTKYARHLIQKLNAHDTSEFPAIFAVVELWHIEGAPYVKEAATIGLLEDLQNGNLHTTSKPDDFVVWLGPRSRRGWDEVEAFWQGGTLPAQ